MTKLSTADIQKMEVKILIMEDMMDHYINSTSLLKHPWDEIHDVELMKLEDLIGNIPKMYLAMEAERLKEPHPTAFKPADIIDPIIIEKALYNEKIESGNQ